jgi:hypothetical protein
MGNANVFGALGHQGDAPNNAIVRRRNAYRWTVGWLNGWTVERCGAAMGEERIGLH